MSLADDPPTVAGGAELVVDNPVHRAFGGQPG
jgi:hypothetical protein